MRRLVVLAVFCALWTGLAFLEQEQGAGSAGEVTAGLGLVVLTAIVFGELVSRLGLPRLAGYLATGIVVGPGMVGLLRGSLFEALGPVESVALGLLALQAGLLMDVKRLRAVAVPAAWMLLTTAVFVLVLGGAAAMVLAPLVPGLDPGPEAGEALGVVMGALLLTASPVVVGAVLTESSARGRLADLALLVTLLLDVLAMVVVTFAWSGAGAILSGEAGAAPGQIDPLMDLSASIGGGVLLGLLVRVAIGWLGSAAALPMVFLTATALPVLGDLGAETVITFATAGFVAVNLGGAESRLAFRSTVGSVMGPILAPASLVFFATFGARLALPNTWLLGLAAVALVVVRATATGLGARLGARWAGESPEIRRHAWLALIPQGGPTLTMLAVASTVLPDLAAPLAALVGAVVVLHLVLGPVGLKIALYRTGCMETPQESKAAERDAATVAVTDAQVAGETVAPPETDPLSDLDAPADDDTGTPWQETAQGLTGIRDHVRSDGITARLDRVAELIRAVSGHAKHAVQSASTACERAGDNDAMADALREQRLAFAEHVRRGVLAAPPPARAENVPTVVHLVAQEVEPLVRAAPAEVLTYESDLHVETARGDGVGIRLGKLSKRGTRALGRFFGHMGKERIVPYRRIVRRVIAGELVAALAPVEALVGRAEFKALRRLETLVRAADGVFTDGMDKVAAGEEADAVRAWLQTQITNIRDASEQAQRDVEQLASEPSLRVSEQMAHALDHAARLAETAGTFIVREGHLRYASVAPRAREAVSAAEQEREVWAGSEQALLDRIALWARLVGLQGRLREAALKRALGPARRMHERVGALIRTAQERAGGVLGRFQAHLSEEDDGAEWEPRAEIRALADELSRRVGRPLEGITHALRSGAVIDRLLAALDTATGPLPAEILLLPETEILNLDRGRPADGQPVSVPVRSVARRFFDRRVAVRLAEHMRALENSAEEALSGLRDTLRLMELRLTRDEDTESSPEDEGNGQPARVLTLWIDTLHTTIDRLGQEIAQTAETAAALSREADDTEQRAVVELWERLQQETRRPGIEEAVSGLRRRIDGFVRSLVHHPIADQVRSVWSTVTHRLRGEAGVSAADADEALPGPAALRRRLKVLVPDDRDVPYVYGKLFSLDATENEAFVVEREEAVTRIRDLVARGEGGTAVVVGPRGSGRTSVLRVALSVDVGRRSTIWLSADRPFGGGLQILKWIGRASGMGNTVDLAGLTAHLRHRAPVLVVDGLEHLMERSAGGLAALDALTALIGATCTHVTWLATAEESVWDLLGEVAPVADVFDDVVSLPGLSAEGIRLAVTRRHRLSGLELEYQQPPALSVEAIWWRMSGMSADRDYFRWLAEESRGCPRAALLLWVLSLRRKDERVFEVCRGPELKLDALHRVPLRLASVLLLALEHSILDAEHLARALGWSELQAQSGIAALAAMGLMTSRPRADGERVWMIPRWAEQTVSRHLADIGLLPVGGVG